jgi:hypothetical protein
MRVSKVFGERTSVLKSDDPKKKYFFAYEGSETERLYFEGIEENKNRLGINVLIEMVPLLRSYHEAGWSHPQRLLSCLIKYLQQMEEGQFKVASIIDWTIDYLVEAKLFSKVSISKNEIRTYLLEILMEKEGVTEEDTVSSLTMIAKQIVDSLQEKISICEVIQKLNQHLMAQAITYDPSFDYVCIIVDRDKKSFKDDQYDCVMKTCTDQGFHLYITNPCFEFWLLMHFDDVFDLDMEKIKNNVNVVRNRKYTEDELRKLVPGYKKNDIRFQIFVNKIDNAIKNEKQFTEDLSSLKDTVGSNVGKLITQLRQ